MKLLDRLFVLRCRSVYGWRVGVVIAKTIEGAKKKVEESAGLSVVVHDSWTPKGPRSKAEEAIIRLLRKKETAGLLAEMVGMFASYED